MKKQRSFRYTDKSWFVVSVETELDVRNLKEYFGLPKNAVLEWLEGHQGEVLTGAHCHTNKGIEHYELIKSHSRVAYINYN